MVKCHSRVLVFKNLATIQADITIIKILIKQDRTVKYVLTVGVVDIKYVYIAKL